LDRIFVLDLAAFFICGSHRPPLLRATRHRSRVFKSGTFSRRHAAPQQRHVVAGGTVYFTKSPRPKSSIRAM